MFKKLLSAEQQVINNNQSLEADYTAKYKAFMAVNLQDADVYKQSSLDDLKINLPMINGKREPAECDVLTTFFHLKNRALKDYLNSIVDEVIKALPPNFDYYRTEEDAWHISFVMLHDVRPCDMNDPKLRASIKGDKEIEELTDILEKVKFQPFSIQLEGIRIMPHDGSVLAVFYDDGGKMLKLRSEMGEAVEKHLEPKLLKYQKAMVHISLLRVMEKVDAETLEKLKVLQEKYKKTKLFTEDISEFYLGRETQWSHGKVDIIKKYRLN